MEEMATASISRIEAQVQEYPDQIRVTARHLYQAQAQAPDQVLYQEAAAQAQEAAAIALRPQV